MTDFLKVPHTTAILAMTADGKIADKARSPARFGSANDKLHLEKQIAKMDAVLFGNKTLHAYGTTLPVSSPELLQLRETQGKPPQPIQIVCSGLGKINPNLRFFEQSIPRWLLTGQALSTIFEPHLPSLKMRESLFERVVFVEMHNHKIDWINAFQQLAKLGIQRLAVLGGGELVASLLEVHLIDELWLTICPLIFGGVNAPTPVEGSGFFADVAPRLELLEVITMDQEVFLHYRLS
ncbi:MAG: RibD family protein [Microcoleaceae cyanobacterium]